MAAHQAPPSLGFSRQEHWSGLPFPSPMHESEKWKGSRSVVSNPQWPHGLQPNRFLRPWDFPSKSTGVGCHCLLITTLFLLVTSPMLQSSCNFEVTFYTFSVIHAIYTSFVFYFKNVFSYFLHVHFLHGLSWLKQKPNVQIHGFFKVSLILISHFAINFSFKCFLLCKQPLYFSVL